MKRNDGRSVLRGLAGFLVLVCTAPAQAQFSVSPVVVQIPATETEPVYLTVRNEGENSLQFRAYSLDFDMSESGEHVFWAHGSRQESCGNRLRIVPEAFSVSSGQAGTVAVSLKEGPTNRTCWSMVLIETAGSSEGTILVNQRIGVKLYGLSGMPDIAGAVSGGVVTRDSLGVMVDFTVQNGGTWPLRPDGILEIRDLSGAVVAATPIETFSVLPERRRTISVAVKDTDLEPGRYLAIPILDFGADYLSGTQIDFRVED